MAEKKYRVIILGAGFSKPAGLPLGDELWGQILNRSKTLWGRAGMLRDDIDAYIEYRRDCDGVELTHDTMNFEEFLGFLDIEHFLGLRGSDTWSRDGNEGQVVIKTLIGEILANHLPPNDNIPELYLEFARRLQPNDYILTFNYDVLLERALDAVGKPYRLFPDRYKSVSRFSGIVDTSEDEIIILKLHGSIDWFDKSQYLESVKTYKEQGVNSLPSHPVFNGKVDWGLTKILDGPRHDNDPLLNMYRVADVEGLYKQQIMFLTTPWILSPSTNKIVYASALGDFWNGLGVSGWTKFGMTIIGYSLPFHDIYARQTIYSLVRNYQEAYWAEEVSGLKKSPLVLVDYKTTKDEHNEFKKNYRFVDFNKAHLHMSGFNKEAIDKIFS